MQLSWHRVLGGQGAAGSTPVSTSVVRPARWPSWP